MEKTSKITKEEVISNLHSRALEEKFKTEIQLEFRKRKFKEITDKDLRKQKRVELDQLEANIETSQEFIDFLAGL